MLWCYTLFKVLYFSPRSSRKSTTAGHFYRVLYLKGGGGFGNPEARSLGTIESNYKMAATDGERSILTILREKGDCEHSVNVIIDCN